MHKGQTANLATNASRRPWSNDNQPDYDEGPSNAYLAGNLNEILIHTLDWLSYGVLLVDDQFKPLFANQAARSLMKQGRLNLTTKPSLHRADPLAELRQAIINCRRRGSSTSQTCWIGDPALLCTVATIGAPNTPGGLTALFLVDPQQARAAKASDLMGLGLTPAEAMLAAELAKGDRLQACARRLGIASSTARTHLHRIFEKTGAGRQAELMRLIFTSLPALRRFEQ